MIETPTKNGTPLQPRHLADLQKSGLSDDQIKRCGFYSIQTPALVRKVLGWRKYNGDLGDCLAIPFVGRDGKLTGYVRLKPDAPRVGDKGKTIRYEAPKGQPNRAYFPPGTLAALEEPITDTVLFTEGEKKAAKADQEGFPCIGLTGVWSWQKRRDEDGHGNKVGERELIDDLAGIDWNGVNVVIVFDSDAVRNPLVRLAEFHLAEVLQKRGAIVKVVRLPDGEPGPNGEPAKVGLDDFIVVHGPEEFRTLVDAAVEPAAPDAADFGPNEAADDPDRLAHLYLDAEGRHENDLRIRNHQDDWHRWEGTAYQLVPAEEMQAAIYPVIRNEFERINLLELMQWEMEQSDEAKPTVRKITKGMMANVEMAMAAETVLPGTIEPPAWWDGSQWIRRNLISLANGLLDLDALFGGRAEVLLPHTPRWFSPIILPYIFDLGADCPRWLAFLNRNLEADDERIALLQEVFGLCLVRDTTRQKFIVFEGEGSNGKSVVCAALEALLGAANCSHVPLEVFGERFQLTPTIGKLANIASEVGELDKAAEGFLKSFTSGDTMQFDRKHKSPIQAVPTARLVIATNNRPRFSDRSGGLWRRMILMPFRVTISETDPGRVFGMDKATWWEASGELPGVLNWALAGLDRLLQQDRFTRSEVCEQALAEYRCENNPARMFLSETCRESTDSQTPCGELYRAYRTWCEGSGYSPLADRAFGKEVRRVYPKVERREVGGRVNRSYCYCGLAAEGL